MKIIALCLPLLISSFVFATPLKFVSLKTLPPNNDFSKCAMAASNAQLIHSKSEISPFMSALVDKQSPALLASLAFDIGSADEATRYNLVVRSLDQTRGWQFGEGMSESWVFAFTADSEAQLFDAQNQLLGTVDLTSCGH